MLYRGLRDEVFALADLVGGAVRLLYFDRSPRLFALGRVDFASQNTRLDDRDVLLIVTGTRVNSTLILVVAQVVNAFSFAEKKGTNQVEMRTKR